MFVQCLEIGRKTLHEKNQLSMDLQSALKGLALQVKPEMDQSTGSTYLLEVDPVV